MALYGKYRPAGFEQIVGQEAVVRALQAGLDQNRLAHALLLSGPHGIGKTTLARIIARGLLCSTGPTSQPCDQCPDCLACQTDSHPDLLEIDAASNRGVDDARALRERLGMAPMQGRCHVIIVDEAHMLTREAQNALLKALEEPPGEVHFIFATTAASKVLPTIRSRCQHFSLQRPSGEQIMQALSRAAQGEGMEISPEALAAIAGITAGSFRDALTLLDQVHSGNQAGEITAGMVYDLAGLPGPQAWSKIVGAVAEGDAGAVLSGFQELEQAGYDLRETLGDLAHFLRMVLYAQQAGGIPENLAIHPLAAQQATSLGQALSPEKLFALIGTVEDAYAKAAAGGSAGWVLESGFSAAAGGYSKEAVTEGSPANIAPSPTQPAATAQPAPVAAPKPAQTPAPTSDPEPAKQQAKPAQAAAPAPGQPSTPGQTEAPAKTKAKPQEKPEPEAQKKTKAKGKGEESVELPGPAVAAAAFPLMTLALRQHHPEAYLLLRTAWARYEEGRLIVQPAKPLGKAEEREVLSVLRRMVDGSVKTASRPKPQKASKTKTPSAAPAEDPGALLAQFGLTPLDGQMPQDQES